MMVIFDGVYMGNFKGDLRALKMAGVNGKWGRNFPKADQQPENVLLRSKITVKAVREVL